MDDDDDDHPFIHHNHHHPYYYDKTELLDRFKFQTEKKNFHSSFLNLLAMLVLSLKRMMILI